MSSLETLGDKELSVTWNTTEDVSPCHPSFCQEHILGKATVPQGMRSLRRVRAQPSSPDDSQRCAKKQCRSGLTASTSVSDFNDADIVELLLGLSHSHSSSPRDSNVSEDDCLVLSPGSSQEVVTPREGPARRSKRVGRQPLKLMHTDTEEEEESNGAEHERRSQTPPTKLDPVEKKVPARCKCGKRVSASHPPCKSELMLLCEKFRDRFAHAADGPACRIDLNECATILGVARRRLYDITIVYEAAEVIVRTGKLAYVWQGLGHLPELMRRLKREEETGQPVGDRRGNVPIALVSERQTTHSLWALSRKFIRLLLTTEGAIQLSDAAEHLIGGPCKEGKRQQTRLTVERRLYDIGSILSTLNLIQRTYVEGKRQPAFSWNWQWANNDPRPGTPPSRSEVRPLAEAGSPQAVAVPLFTAPHSAGSPPPAAVGPSALESLPQLTFPGLGGNSQSELIRTKIMCLPSFPVISHPTITSGLPNFNVASGSASPYPGMHTMPHVGGARTSDDEVRFGMESGLARHVQAQRQTVAIPSAKPTLADFFRHCTDVANTSYLMSSGKHYQSIFQQAQLPCAGTLPC